VISGCGGDFRFDLFPVSLYTQKKGQGVVAPQKGEAGMIGVLVVTTFVLYSAVAVLLVWKYRGTRDAGFLWLSLPLVLLPFMALPLALWLQAGVDRLELGQQVSTFPFTLVEQGCFTMGGFLTLLNLVEHVVWGVLSLVAVLALNGSRKAPDGENMH
jgi:hypothetical protein